MTFINELKELAAPQLLERLKAGSAARDRVTDVLNFFEEVAYAAKLR